MARHMHKDVLAIFTQEADPGRGKIGHGGGGEGTRGVEGGGRGVPFFKKLLQIGRLQQ